MGATSLRLEGASNFRDIGGGIGADGRRIKREHLFRSGELSRLTDADVALLRRLRVGFIADLRSSKECELLRSRLPDVGVVLHLADITMDVRLNGRHIMDYILDDPTPEGTARVLASSFGMIADLCGPALKVITEKIARDSEPVLFHCTNGRDRTGTVAAMLLYMLGASRKAIVEDFMLTNERIDVELVIRNSMDTMKKTLGMELSREMLKNVTLVRPEYIAALFAALDEKYGSADGYLAHFGIDAPLTEALRERLLDA